MTYYVTSNGICYTECHQTTNQLARRAGFHLCGLIDTLLMLRAANPDDFRTAVFRAIHALLRSNR